MIFNRSIERTFVCVAVAVLLASCAAQRGANGTAGSTGNGSTASSDPCDVGKSAVVGALAGALLGALIGGQKGAAQGAVGGGALGAISCYTMNVQSRQTKTAVQADTDYKQSRGALPQQPSVVSYTPTLASQTVRRGQPVKINSTLEVVNGTSESINDVKEEINVYNPDGSLFKTGSKPFNASSSGRFENAFELTLPASARQGVYTMKTAVSLNGKQSATRDLSTQIVWDGTSATLVAAR